MAKIGAIIDGKYTVLAQIGKGGMSTVYLAMDNRLNKQWAIKEIRKTANEAANKVIIQSLLDEANLMKKLDHPNLPRIVDIVDTGATIYVVEDYIEGFALNKVLKEKGAQKQEDVIYWAKQLCDALGYLHGRNPAIIYRDMKPGNVMLRPDNSIKLIDFGIAREYKEDSVEDTVNLGTRGYAAPEQFGGKGQTDARTDIYCLGVTMYHLVTGKDPSEPPYELYPIRHWNPSLSTGLEKIIQKCTQNNPDDRYQSCAELYYALENYEKLDESYRKAQKKKLRRFLVPAALCLVMAVAGVSASVAAVKSEQSSYEYLMDHAAVSSDEETKEKYLLDAIDLRPEDPEAYLELMDAYKSDAVFTVEEQQELQQRVNDNLEALRKTPDWADFAFRLGKLYWYYSDYGGSNNTFSRVKNACPWFEETVTAGGENGEHYTMAKVYAEIGAFHSDISLRVMEADDAGLYAPYWEKMKELIALTEADENTSEIVSLETGRLVITSVETYARKLKYDGISAEEITATLEEAETLVKDTVTTTDRTDEIREELLDQVPFAAEAVTQAFGE